MNLPDRIFCLADLPFHQDGTKTKGEFQNLYTEIFCTEKMAQLMKENQYSDNNYKWDKIIKNDVSRIKKHILYNIHRISLSKGLRLG